MKTKKFKTVNINLSLSKETPVETVAQLGNVLNNFTAPQQRDYELYLTTDEIDELNDRYSALFKKIGADIDLSETQREKERAVLSEKYDFEIEHLSKSHEKEYRAKQATIEADNFEQIPWRRCWLWKLIGRPTTNRAQDIIELRAELEAEEKFAPEEERLDELEKKLFSGTGKKLTERKRKRLMQRYLKLRRKLIGNPAATCTALPVQPSATEEHACDAVHHCGDVGENLNVIVTEPPEPPARKPRKPTQTRG